MLGKECVIVTIPWEMLLNSLSFLKVGDPKQLPATVLSNIASKYLYQCSMFERLQRAGHPVVMLTQQVVFKYYHPVWMVNWNLYERKCILLECHIQWFTYSIWCAESSCYSLKAGSLEGYSWIKCSLENGPQILWIQWGPIFSHFSFVAQVHNQGPKNAKFYKIYRKLRHIPYKLFQWQNLIRQYLQNYLHLRVKLRSEWIFECST